MNRQIDLHVHTAFSDGTLNTGDVVDVAIETGLSAIAITDHDTIDGLKGFSTDKIELIPGIEFSTRYKSKVHILGYYLDLDNKELNAELKSIVDDRDNRNEQIVTLMRNDGINISYSDMKDRFGTVVGRPHFATILIEAGLVSTVDEAFDIYLDKGRKYWVPRKTLELDRAIKLITGAGGIASIAHPFEYSYEKNSIAELINVCMNYGVKGMECRHSSHSPGQMAFLENLCEDFGLIKTGGSDYHGSVKPKVRLGCGEGLVSVPYTWLEKLKEAR